MTAGFALALVPGFFDAADPAVPTQAAIADAVVPVVATPDTLSTRRTGASAHPLRPDIEVVQRTLTQDGSTLLRNTRVGTVFFGNEEIDRGMTAPVLQRFHRPSPG